MWKGKLEQKRAVGGLTNDRRQKGVFLNKVFRSSASLGEMTSSHLYSNSSAAKKRHIKVLHAIHIIISIVSSSATWLQAACSAPSTPGSFPTSIPVNNITFYTDILQVI